MKTEYEVRILEVDKDLVIKNIEELGGKKLGDYHQKRYVYDLKPVEKGKWIRLRTNGKKTTLTYKDVVSKTIDGTKEVEIVVDDFERTNEFLNRIGFVPRSFQENLRIQYELDGCEIDIDTWPMIPTYMEIEGNSEVDIQSVKNKMDLSNYKETCLNPDDIYRDIYNIDISTISELKF